MGRDGRVTRSRREPSERRVAGDQRRALLAVLGVHLAAALAHGSTHALVPVALGPWTNALVLGTVFLGPVVGAALAVRGHPSGLPLFTASMAGAFLLGLTLHFLVPGADHVHAVPASAWRLPFGATAVGVTVAPALGAAAGARWLWNDG